MINGRRSPESVLWSAVVALAIDDLRNPNIGIRDSSLTFFQGDWLDKVIAMTGIEQDSIPRLRKQALLLYSQPPRKGGAAKLMHRIMSDDSPDDVDSE